LPGLVSDASQIQDDFSRVTMPKSTIFTATEKKAFFNRHQAQWIRFTGTNYCMMTLLISLKIPYLPAVRGP
jgi:hypothetical protein